VIEHFGEITYMKVLTRIIEEDNSKVVISLRRVVADLLK